MLPPSLLVFPYKGWPDWSPTARNIPPAQPSARQDALFPERDPSNSFNLSLGEWPRLPSTARIERAHPYAIDPSKLANFLSLGRALMLVYVRPSNEALLRARVPGAQDQRGCPSHPFHSARSASKKGTWPLPPHLSEATPCASTEDHQAPSPPLFREQEDNQAQSNTPSMLARILSRRGA
jgi:hypothetical protein